MKAKMIDQQGKDAGEVSLSEEVFGAKPYEHLLFDMVVAQQASHRQGTAKTKTRSEVRGGGVKPYKQKGTGQARRGTNRSPLMPGGGRMFGPIPRKYGYRMPITARLQALRTALSQKQREGKLIVVKEFGMKKPNTKEMIQLLTKIEAKSALFVDAKNDGLDRSVRNLPTAKYLDVVGLNVRDVLKYDRLVLSSSSIKTIEERLMP